MKKFTLKMRKTVTCIVLATIMVISGILPVMASSADDLTGWTVGSTNTITGNPTDGWDVVLGNGSILDINKFARYEFDGFADELQITMDLSEVDESSEIFFQMATQPNNVYSWAWNGNCATFAMKKRNGALRVYRHTGGEESVHAVFENFDFTVPHIFEFLQDDNDEYHLAIDGTLCLTPWNSDDSWDTSVDAYVTQGGANEYVTVSLSIVGVNTINNMKFSKKVTVPPSPTPSETPTATPSETPTATPSETPIATPEGGASATPGISNQPTGDVSMIAIVALVLAVGSGMIVLRKKSCKE